MCKQNIDIYWIMRYEICRIVLEKVSWRRFACSISRALAANTQLSHMPFPHKGLKHENKFTRDISKEVTFVPRAIYLLLAAGLHKKILGHASMCTPIINEFYDSGSALA